MSRSAWVTLAIAVPAFSAACAGTGSPATPDPGPLQIRASSLLGGTVEEGGMSGAELAARVDRLLREGRRKSADRLVRRRPDTAYLALASGTAGTPMLALASFHDRHSSLHGTASGWESLLRDRLGRPERYAAYDEARERVHRLLREGRIDEAAAEPAPSVPDESPATPLLRIESARLAAAVRLLADRPAAAAAELEPGLAAARAGRPLDAAHLLLLLGEAQRRMNREDAAKAAWIEAVSNAAALLDRSGEVLDPGLWERALNLKPAGAEWPPAVRDVLLRRAATVLGVSVEAGTPEAALRTLLGSRRLDRGESRAALAHFTKPDGAGAWTPGFRLGQARALLALGQVDAARTLLTPMAGATDGPWVRESEALLGALELKLGALDRARTLLERAAQGGTGSPHAEANLGLALLSLGQEPEGLRRLRSAQARFAAVRDLDGLDQCLRNELRWAESAGRPQDVDRVREQLAALEAP